MACGYNAWKLTLQNIVGTSFTVKEDSTNVPVVTEPCDRIRGSVPKPKAVSTVRWCGGGGGGGWGGGGDTEA